MPPLWYTISAIRYEVWLKPNTRHAQHVLSTWLYSEQIRGDGSSFQKAQALVRELKEAEKPSVLALAGLRGDLADTSRSVLFEEASSFASFNDMIFLVCSNVVLVV
jgi:hypothetical protein